MMFSMLFLHFRSRYVLCTLPFVLILVFYGEITSLGETVSRAGESRDNATQKDSAGELTNQYSHFPAAPSIKKNKIIVLISGDEEYRSEEEMNQLGRILATHHGFDTYVLYAIDPKTGLITPTILDNIPGLSLLKTADLIILGLRFRNLPTEQMKAIEDYLLSGRPLIGTRTSTHAFNLDKASPYYHYTWNYQGEKSGWQGGFGRKILGETWVSHHGQHAVEGTRGIPVAEQKNHPVLRSVTNINLKTDVYTVHLRPEDHCQTILLGQVIAGFEATDSPVNGEKNNPMMPLAWFKSYQLEGGKKGEIFTTTMGSGQDLLNEGFRRLMVNVSYFLLKQEVPEKANVELIGPYDPLNYGFGKFRPEQRP